MCVLALAAFVARQIVVVCLALGGVAGGSRTMHGAAAELVGGCLHARARAMWRRVAGTRGLFAW
jgi:hypothetical protein